jgi:hypothetical protein
VLRNRWINEGNLSQDEIESLDFNRAHNPDSRVRKSAADLLAAAAGLPSGHAAGLLEKRNTRRLQNLIRSNSAPYSKLASGS